MSLKSLNTLGLVLAHGKARETVLRHEPVWKQNCDRLVYFTPVDDRLNLPGRIEFSTGKSCGYCADTNLRCREALRFASMTGYAYVILFEYDSLIFAPVEKVFATETGTGSVVAPRFLEPNPGGKFDGSFYLHFPIWFDNHIVPEVVGKMDEMRPDAEGGFTDRYVGRAVELAGVRVVNLNRTPHAYTQNHIDKARLPEAVEAYRKGAFWSHGIKDAFTFAQLQANVQS